MWTAIFITASIFFPILILYVWLDLRDQRANRLDAEQTKAASLNPTPKVIVKNDYGMQYPVDEDTPTDMKELLARLDQY